MDAQGGLSDFIDRGVQGGAETKHWFAGALLLLIVFALYHWRQKIRDWWTPAKPATFKAVVAQRERSARV